MKTITRILITLMAALLVLPEVSFAKSKTLDTFVSKVSSSLVSFDYSFTMPTKKAKMTGNGSVKVQGTSFIVDGNGLEIWCDGRTRWTIDRISEEALVESVDDSYDSYATNPALMIASIDNAFREESFGSSKFGGKKGFYQQQFNDNKKRRFCALHEFNLVEIPYTDENLLSYDYILQKAGY